MPGRFTGDGSFSPPEDAVAAATAAAAAKAMVQQRISSATERRDRDRDRDRDEGERDCERDGERRSTAIIECPHRLVGWLLGKSGEAVKDMQMRSGCNIQVSSCIARVLVVGAAVHLDTLTAMRTTSSTHT